MAIGRLVLGAGLLIGLLVVLGPDWDAVAAQVDVQVLPFVVGFLGTTAATILTAARWRLLNERMTQTSLPWGAYLHYVAATRFVGQFVPMLLMDLVGRGAGLRAAGSKQGLGQLVTPVLLERFLDILIPAAMLVWAIIVSQGAMSLEVAWAGAIGVALLLGLASIPLIRPIANLVLRAYVRIKNWRGSDLQFEAVDVSTGTATWVSIYSLGRYATVLLQFAGMGAAVGAVIPAFAVFSGFAIAQMSALLAITPGGLGIQDLGWAGGLQWQGVDEATVALFVLGFRVLMIVNFGLLTLLTWPLRQMGASAPTARDLSQSDGAD